MSRWIVCGIARDRNDGSTVKVAARLADHLGARLAIVTVLSEPATGDARDAVAKGRCAVADLARRCGVVDDAVHCVELGDAVEQLARVSEDLDAEMIVVGGTRRSALTSLVRAGVAPRLSRQAGRPVAVVPPGSGGSDDAVRVLAAAAGGRRVEKIEPLAAARRRLATRMSGHARRPVVIVG